MLGRNLFFLVLSFCVFSSLAHGQDYENYSFYLEDIYHDGTVRRCYEVIPIQNTVPAQAQVLDFSCPKSLACYECSFASALYRIQSFVYYNDNTKFITYLEGELRQDKHGFWHYIVLPPYDNPNLLHDPTYLEEYEKNISPDFFKYNSVASPGKLKKPADWKEELEEEWERWENKHRN